MMVEVFVHPGAPLVGCELAEEGMGMFGALRFPALMKLPDAHFELFLFAVKIARIGDHELRVGRAIPGKRFIVAIDGPEDPPD